MCVINLPSLIWKDIPKLTASQMQQVIMQATGKYGIDARLIVEHTGRNLAELAHRFAPDGPVLVVAGRGNNGSGGLAAARLLASHGRQVWVVPTHEAENYSGPPKEQLELLKNFASVRVKTSIPKMKFGCAIDAGIGTRLEGPPRGRTLDAITVMNNIGCCVIAVDTPTGMLADTGEVPGDAVKATMTMSLALPKKGVKPGEYTGDLYIGDVGVPAGVYTDMGITPPKLPYFLVKVEEGKSKK